MTARIYDFTAIRFAVETIERMSPDSRLLALKNLTENNGIWTIPERSDCYVPVLFEISLYGVTAIADDPDRLAPNWLKAANAILRAAA